MANYVIATARIHRLNELKAKYHEHRFFLIQTKEELTKELLCALNPEFVFFPHWSWIIPSDIYDRFPCVVFHMTDLPFGRGGSPLQNLLARGIYKTKISAIKVQKGIDTGDVYLQEPFDISEGSAHEIISRAADIIYGRMIPRLIEGNLSPKAQEGEPVVFSRRKPGQSEIPGGLTARQVYDYIRMLDGEGYPPAYINTAQGKIYFRNAKLRDGKVMAEAEFEREEGV